jgi:glycerate kinase
MRILVAPDSFKGSLTAGEAARAMACGIRTVLPEAEVVEFPVADGGEGTMEVLVSATGGSLREAVVQGPLGDPVQAAWGVLGDGATAVGEMAAAAGLLRVPLGQRNPLAASTFGTGELVRAALDGGFRRILLGLGGSATNEGGTGFARALGARFLDAGGCDLPEGGAALTRLARIDLSGLDPRLASTEVVALCDVDAPLCGPRGASALFGPQKGATPEMVRRLEDALGNLAQVAAPLAGYEVPLLPGAGAAGGFGAGLAWFVGAHLRPGVEPVLDAIGFEAALEGAHLVFTGEGRTDAQTALGKAPAGVAALAHRHRIPVVCLSGGLGEGADQLLGRGVDALAAVPPEPMDLDASLARASELLASAAARACRLLQVGRRLAPVWP